MAERALAEQQQQDGVTYRVATKGHAPDALWELHGAEFAEKALAQEWAHFLLWSAAPQSERPRNATVVPVVDGVLRVPFWMHVRQDATDEEAG